ncbi:MAG TPA: hypothetical protein VK009_02300 [Chloroflexota bacterium]|nr:hypothetical protein [Chloroflexota bacterium]
MVAKMARVGMLALLWSAAGIPAARADESVTYSPGPGFAGSNEQFDACGLQQGETADLILDGNVVAQGTADTGCVHITYQTAIDIAPGVHALSVKGETSGTEVLGNYVVAPPTVPSPPAPVQPGGTTMVMGQFFAPNRTPMLLGDAIAPSPGVTDMGGGLQVAVTVLPNTPPGTYPVIIQDPPWLTNPPVVLVTVLPQPSDAPVASGAWTLTATSTLSRDSAPAVNGSGTFTAQFSVANGQVSGQGQMGMALDMEAPDGTGCHGDAAPTPFTVGGTGNGSQLHLVFTGKGVGTTITVKCSNGLTLPFTLPAGSDSVPFDIEAKDGNSVDFDGTNPFLVVPSNLTGHTHVALSKS